MPSQWQQLSHSRVMHIVIKDPEYPHFVTQTLCGLHTHRTMFNPLLSTRECKRCAALRESGG